MELYPSLALADGDHVFTATATNDRGTSGQSVSFTIDIDTQPPVLEGLAVSDVGDRLTGTTEAGSTVVIKDSQEIRSVVERQATTVPSQ